MIDLTKPIRTECDGREAKYLGELPDGSHAFGYEQNGRWYVDHWFVIPGGFENIPLAPPKLTGFCPVVGQEVWTSRTFEECSELIKECRYHDISELAIDLSTLTEKNYVRVSG